MAAYGIGNKVNGLITLLQCHWLSDCNDLGQNMGAKQPERAERGYRFSMWISVVFLFVGGMILSRDMISTAIVGIFSKDAEVVGMAADFLSVMAFWCFTNGVYNTTSGLFQGTGHTEVTMAHRCDQIVGIPFPDTVVCEMRPAYGRAQCLVFRGDQ